MCVCVCVVCAHVKHRIFTALLMHSQESKQQKAEQYVNTNGIVCFLLGGLMMTWKQEK